MRNIFAIWVVMLLVNFALLAGMEMNRARRQRLIRRRDLDRELED